METPPGLNRRHELVPRGPAEEIERLKQENKKLEHDYKTKPKGSSKKLLDKMKKNDAEILRLEKSAGTKKNDIETPPHMRPWSQVPVKDDKKKCPPVQEVCMKLMNAVKKSPHAQRTADMIQSVPSATWTTVVASGLTLGMGCMEKSNMGTVAAAGIVCGATWATALRQWAELVKSLKDKLPSLKKSKSLPVRRDAVQYPDTVLRQRRRSVESETGGVSSVLVRSKRLMPSRE